jgi:hypothetical protein
MPFLIGQCQGSSLTQMRALADALKQLKAKVCAQRLLYDLRITLTTSRSRHAGCPQKVLLEIDRSLSFHPMPF